MLLLCLCAAAEEPVLRNLPIAWFEAPDHHAPHWRVDFEHPGLTYSERIALDVKATISVNETENRTDWHIILRIADGAGNWFESYGYYRLDLRPSQPGPVPVSWQGRVFVQPGTYRLALLAYNAENQQHFVWHKSVNVKRPGELPDLDRNLPRVEFVHRDRNESPIPEYLPVRTQAPLRIDLIFNVTPSLQLDETRDYNRQKTGGKYVASVRPSVEETIRGAAVVLTQLAPSRGCVRVSAVDILRLRVPTDRSSAAPISTIKQVNRAIESRRDAAVINVATLAGRTKAREFFHQFINEVVSDNTGCGPELPFANRIIVVVSDSLVFPQGDDSEPVLPAGQEPVRFFHIRFSATYWTVDNGVRASISAQAHSTFDEVGRLLKPFQPRTFDVAQPQDLRHAVAQIVKDISFTKVLR